MNYQETLKWMFNQLPMFQNIGKLAYKEDLMNTILLTNYLGNPEQKLKCIHVAGTNGKGSCCSMLASILHQSGYKVGLYTSPHMKDFRERIKINGKKITKTFVVGFMAKHKNFFEKNNLSFFEMTVGLCLDYFASAKVDIAIIEVGMGGRLDSTNIITPLISIITNIGLDHTQFLGNTVEKIAIEKAGIIKRNVPIVIGEYLSVTKPIFLDKAIEMNAEIYFASDLISVNYESILKGDYQFHNTKTVVQTIKVLQNLTNVDAERPFLITEKDIKKGLKNVIKNTGLMGRWQQLKDKPKVICDTAHNKNGIEIVVNQILKENFNQLHIVFGVVKDKDLNEILPLLPKNAIYYFCKPNLERGLDASILKQKSKFFNLNGSTFSSVTNAYETALLNANNNDLIYIGGSTFVVAEVL